MQQLMRSVRYYPAVYLPMKNTLPRGDGDSAQTLSGSEDMASATAVRLGSNSKMIIKVMY